MKGTVPHIAVIGAGIGGLAAALRLAHGGARVTVLERHGSAGGKMRTLPTAAGPVDAGPTVLTLKTVFEDLFRDTGSALSDHVTLHRESVLARHFWPDGTRLDLVADQAESTENVARVFGSGAAAEFTAFCAHTRTLFDAFDGPMMRSAAPSQGTLAARMLRQPDLLHRMEPRRSLAESLAHRFTEPKLRQLFGRYATYVGGIPPTAPALLSLIWQAEAQGVWSVEGGMYALARAIEARAAELGARFHYGTHVSRIRVRDGRADAIVTDDATVDADAVLFNGDPRALHAGYLGDDVRRAVARKGVEPRSLSAMVHSFAAEASGLPLAAHNVLFCADPDLEFGPLSRGEVPSDASLYICAQDRFGGQTPTGTERFEIITNAPAVPDAATLTEKERQQWHATIMARLRRFGLMLSPGPAPETLTLPQNFAALFPASGGALYGRSPQGMMAAFHRPTVRSRIKGLYLTGGGVHPGAGVPMATRSAAHAAEAIMTDLSST
ncbi:methoxyneurosporene dehydrogenase (plasmid) [Sulfitobacter alexandrii]|uniref:Methoxyneurosporene dehydrogenase n=1 Tax=Sulfitobacter alexandrii TaxID=1917485 RepID=A0A1J0WNG3_9RHOB|nr:methoxyneurosporene dehydrogenase [Sulfitobacter alexandrii]